MVKLGIISLSHPHSRGNHLPALKYMQDRIQVAGIYHDDVAVAQPWLDITGATYYSSRDDLLADPAIDVVLVTSVNKYHAEDCIAAAKAGKDILCDKPIAMSPEEAVQIKVAVEESGVKFFTTFPVRFNQTVQQVKKLVDEGAFGEIKAIMATNHGCMYEPGVPEWVLAPELNGGGCLVDHTVHVADIIRWLTGQEFADVMVEMEKAALHDYIVAEDIAVLHGRMENGIVYQIDASWNRRPQDPMWGDVAFRIVGSKGSASLSIYNQQRVELYQNGEVLNMYPNLIVYEHGCIFDDYVRYKKTGESTGADETDGLRVQELVAAGYASAEAEKRVAVHKNY